MSDYQARKEEGMRLLGIHLATPLPPPAPPTGISPLQTYTADTLHNVTLERPLAIINGFLVAGLSILAGMPKLGKSWLALWLSICVSAGSDFLGMRCLQGSVLYLDLESRQYRVQERLAKLMKGEAPPRLYVAHEAARLDGGLIGQIDMWCNAVENPRLIIVDTFVKVKSKTQRGENAYEADYRILSELQAYALKRGVAIILVHHLKKNTLATADPLERVSGSTGITGVADAIYMLDRKRDQREATLMASGRDFEDQSLAVQFDDGRWVCLGSDSAAYQAEKAYRSSPIAQGIHQLMAGRQRWEGSVSSLLDEFFTLGIEPDGIRTAEKLGKELALIEEALRCDGIQVRRQARRDGGKVKRFIVLESGTSQPAFEL